MKHNRLFSVLLFAVASLGVRGADDALFSWNPTNVEAIAVRAARDRYPSLRDRPLRISNLHYTWMQAVPGTGSTNRPPNAWASVQLLVEDSISNSAAGPTNLSITTRYETVSVTLTSSGTVTSVSSGGSSSSRGNPAYVAPPPPTFPPRQFASVAEFALDQLGFDFAGHDFGSPPEQFAGFTPVTEQPWHDPLDPPPPVNTNLTRYRQTDSSSNAFHEIRLTFLTNRLSEVAITISGVRTQEAAHRFTELSGKALTDWGFVHDDGRHHIAYRGACGNAKPVVAHFTFTASTNWNSSVPKR